MINKSKRVGDTRACKFKSNTVNPTKMLEYM